MDNSLIEEEMVERGMTVGQMARAMALADAPVWMLTVEMLLALREEPGLMLGQDTARRIAEAFGMEDGGKMLLRLAGEAEGADTPGRHETEETTKAVQRKTT